MFSSLGPLFKATFRHAEETDTRMAIRKDDPRDHRRKQEAEDEQPDSGDLWEDSTTVSVDSLYTFLTNFVAGRTQAVSGKAGDDAGDGPGAAVEAAPPVPEERAPQNTRAARAMHAYQSLADKAGTGYHRPSPAPQSDVELVEGGDVRIIHALIADLKTLLEKGVTTLTLEKSDSFLHSLQEAVARAHSTF